MSKPRIEIKAASREIVRGRVSGTFLTFSIPLEHKNGHVFLLADIDSACKIAPKIISLLRETVERLARKLNDQSHLQNRFEQILQSVNNDLKELVNVKTCPPESLNMIIGVLKNENFIISATGTLPALFLRKTAKQRFKVFDLQQSVSTEAGKTNNEKLFHVVLDGDLQPDDVLLIASRDLHRLVSVEDIHPLISTLPPGSALETIEQYLPTNAKLAMLLFQVRSEKDVVTGFGPEVSSDASMKALNGTEQDTEETLELEKPHIYQSIAKLVNSIKSGDKLERRDATKRLGRKLLSGAKKVGFTVLQIISNGLISLASLIQAGFMRGSKRERALHNAKSAWSRTWKSGHKKFQLASITGKLFLVGGTIFILLFVSSIVFFNLQKTSKEADLAFASQIEAIDDLRSQAEARVIYKDDASARALLNDALTQLNTLDAKGKEARQNEIDLRQQEIANELNAVRKVLVPQITSTPIVNQLVSASSISTLFFQDGAIGVFADGNISFSTPSGGSSATKLATSYNGDAVTINADNAFIYFNATENSMSTIGINTVEGEAENARDLVHYGERLYVLSNDTIYRHQRVEGGEYGPGSRWIQDGTELTGAQSIAIDGTLWVGGEGTLQHFDKGLEVGASGQSIDPPLGTVKDLWTDTDVSIVFVLDPSNHRVVAYSKETADMIGQFVDNAFNDAINISIDIGSKTATVVSPTTIHTFSVGEVL